MESVSARTITVLLDQIERLKYENAELKARTAARATAHPHLVSPSPLAALRDGPDSFTYDTVTKRMPSIVTTIMEHNTYSAEIIQGLNKLASDMREGAPLRLLQAASASGIYDIYWNVYIRPYLGETWLSAPWWLVENYLYKRVLEVTPLGQDPFARQKELSLESAKVAFCESVLPLVAQETDIQPFLERSLWGNKADLSLSAGKAADTRAGTGSEILVDDGLAVKHLLQPKPASASSKEVVMVLDNCGLEIVCDLALADGLLRHCCVEKVTLHVKDFPVFVSDVCIHDIEITLAWMAKEGGGEMVARLRNFMQQGRLAVFVHEFYTSPLPYWDAPADLCKMYQRSALVIVKGDANYRRCCGDLHWAFDTPFADVMSYFPAPLLALRTNKSGVCVGVPKKIQAEAQKNYPGELWLVKGVFGLIQLKA